MSADATYSAGTGADDVEGRFNTPFGVQVVDDAAGTSAMRASVTSTTETTRRPPAWPVGGSIASISTGARDKRASSFTQMDAEHSMRSTPVPRQRQRQRQGERHLRSRSKLKGSKTFLDKWFARQEIVYTWDTIPSIDSVPSLGKFRILFAWLGIWSPSQWGLRRKIQQIVVNLMLILPLVGTIYLLAVGSVDLYVAPLYVLAFLFAYVSKFAMREYIASGHLGKLLYLAAEGSFGVRSSSRNVRSTSRSMRADVEAPPDPEPESEREREPRPGHEAEADLEQVEKLGQHYFSITVGSSVVFIVGWVAILVITTLFFDTGSNWWYSVYLKARIALESYAIVTFMGASTLFSYVLRVHSTAVDHFTALVGALSVAIRKLRVPGTGTGAGAGATSPSHTIRASASASASAAYQSPIDTRSGSFFSVDSISMDEYETGDLDQGELELLQGVGIEQERRLDTLMTEFEVLEKDLRHISSKMQLYWAFSYFVFAVGLLLGLFVVVIRGLGSVTLFLDQAMSVAMTLASALGLFHILRAPLTVSNSYQILLDLANSSRIWDHNLTQRFIQFLLVKPRTFEPFGMSIASGTVARSVYILGAVMVFVIRLGL